MPHQCVKCGTLLEEGSNDLIKGCSSCGGKLFFFIKKERLEQKEKPFILTKSEKKEIEEDIYEIIGDGIDKEKPVILDFEAIHILKPGKYELDLVNLFKKKEPLVYRLEDGKYIVDISETFKKSLEESPEEALKK